MRIKTKKSSHEKNQGKRGTCGGMKKVFEGTTTVLVLPGRHRGEKDERKGKAMQLAYENEAKR